MLDKNFFSLNAENYGKILCIISQQLIAMKMKNMQDAINVQFNKQ